MGPLQILEMAGAGALRRGPLGVDFWATAARNGLRRLFVCPPQILKMAGAGALCLHPLRIDFRRAPAWDGRCHEVPLIGKLSIWTGHSYVRVMFSAWFIIV